MARKYINDSMYLLEARREHEKFIEAFQRYGLSDDLSKLADSAFREVNRDVIEAWDLLLKDWKKREKDVYRKAGITEDEFNWIGGALTDPLNKDIENEINRNLIQFR